MGEATGFIERIKDQLSPSVPSGDRESLNEKNVSKFSESYKKRTPILSDLGKDIKFDVLIIAGAKSKTLEQSETIHRAMAPGCCSIIKVEDVIQPLKEAPEKITEAMNPEGKKEGEEEESIVNPVTMGDYDKPNIRRPSPPYKSAVEDCPSPTLLCQD